MAFRRKQNVGLALGDPIPVKWHPHPLQEIQRDGWSCDGRHQPGGCRRGITGFGQTTGLRRWRCNPCDYDLCDKCMDDAKIVEEKEEKKEKKEKKEEIEETGVDVSMSANLTKFLESGLFCDVIFNVDGKKIPAHRFVLAAHSAVFDVMLYEEEKGGKTISTLSAPLELKVNGVKPEHFQAFIKAIYTEDLDLSIESALPISKLATKYAIRKIQSLCAQYLEAEIPTEEAFKAFTSGELGLGVGLASVVNHFTEFLTSEYFAKLTQDQWRQILKHPELEVTEEIVFTSVLDWLKFQSSDSKEQKEIIKDLLPFIRFPTMPPAVFCELVVSKRLLPESDIISIFSFFSTGDHSLISKLPYPSDDRAGWCFDKDLIHGQDGWTISLDRRSFRRDTSAGSDRFTVLGNRSFNQVEKYWEVFLGTGDASFGVVPAHRIPSSSHLCKENWMLTITNATIAKNNYGVPSSRVPSGSWIGFHLKWQKTHYDLSIYLNKACIGTIKNITSPVRPAFEVCTRKPSHVKINVFATKPMSKQESKAATTTKAAVRGRKKK